MRATFNEVQCFFTWYYSNQIYNTYCFLSVFLWFEVFVYFVKKRELTTSHPLWSHHSIRCLSLIHQKLRERDLTANLCPCLHPPRVPCSDFTTCHSKGGGQVSFPTPQPPVLRNNTQHTHTASPQNIRTLYTSIIPYVFALCAIKK